MEDDSIEIQCAKCEKTLRYKHIVWKGKHFCHEFCLGQYLLDERGATWEGEPETVTNGVCDCGHNLWAIAPDLTHVRRTCPDCGLMWWIPAEAKPPKKECVEA